LIVYLDASALVKRYVIERDSEKVIELTQSATVVATSIVTRAEVAAALARVARLKVLDFDQARLAQRRFAADWPDYAHVPVTEALVARAERLAWDYELRGYDAVQLAAGLMWQESIGEDVLLATFDRQFWGAATRAGLQVWPQKLGR